MPMTRSLQVIAAFDGEVEKTNPSIYKYGP